MKLDSPAPGGAGHQQVGHLGQVGGHEVAFDILADAGEHRIRIVHGLVGAQYVAQVHDFAIGVRNFDADGGFACNRRQDAHIGTGHRVGDVLLQVGDFLDLDARAEPRPHTWVTDGPRRKPMTFASTLGLLGSVPVSARITRSVGRGARRMGLRLSSECSGRATDTVSRRRRMYALAGGAYGSSPYIVNDLADSAGIQHRHPVGSGRGCRIRVTGGSGRWPRHRLALRARQYRLGGTGHGAARGRLSARRHRASATFCATG